MSIKAINWAYGVDLDAAAIGAAEDAARAVSPATAKTVLVNLAWHADKKQECWPGQETIARECGLTTRSVRSALKALLAMGLVKVVRHRLESGRWGLSRFKLVVPRNFAPGEAVSEEGPDEFDPGPDVAGLAAEPWEGKSGFSPQGKMAAPPAENCVNAYIRESSLNSTKACLTQSTVSSPANGGQKPVQQGGGMPGPSPVEAAPVSQPVQATEQEAVVVKFSPRTHRFFGIPDALFDHWEKVYKHIDVNGKLCELEEWARANPAKIKRRHNLHHTIVDALAKANERAYLATLGRFAWVHAGAVGPHS